MSGKQRRARPAVSVEPEVYACIVRWEIVRLKEPNKAPTMHIIGYIDRHGRLIDDAGQPYIGSSLREIDLERRVVVNRRGRVIALVGDPLPPGDLPDDLKAMLRRAEREWELDSSVEWERLEPTEAQGNGSSDRQGDANEKPSSRTPIPRWRPRSNG
jgi:hypothetical protein